MLANNWMRFQHFDGINCENESLGIILGTLE